MITVAQKSYTFSNVRFWLILDFYPTHRHTYLNMFSGDKPSLSLVSHWWHRLEIYLRSFTQISSIHRQFIIHSCALPTKKLRN